MTTTEDIERIAEATANTLEGRRTISNTDHRVHHDFVVMLIERERFRGELKRHVLKVVVGLVVIAMVAAVGSAVLEYVAKLLHGSVA